MTNRSCISGYLLCDCQNGSSGENRGRVGEERGGKGQGGGGGDSAVC